jgi:hypothetical protein
MARQKHATLFSIVSSSALLKAFLYKFMFKGGCRREEYLMGDLEAFKVN